MLIGTPDKDLSQCVVGTRIVQLDRRRDILRDEAGVVAKFGVKPLSIRTTWPWPATAQMASRGCLDGVRRLRPSPYLSIPTWKHSRGLASVAFINPEGSHIIRLAGQRME